MSAVNSKIRTNSISQSLQIEKCCVNCPIRLAAAAKSRMVDDFATFCQQVLDGLHSPTPELQQEVIRLLIDHIIVCPNREVRPNRSAELPCPHSGAMM
jgi:hypothetical protein